MRPSTKTSAATRVAILGGGGVGACTALELARHGVRVDVFEQDRKPLMRASRVNEGKVHLGFLYAKDASLQTARLMLTGAFAFADRLSRWIDLQAIPLDRSTPFIYAVHKDTMVEADALARHYDACVGLAAEMLAAGAPPYLGDPAPIGYRALGAAEIEAILDPEHFAAAFVTSERSVDPRTVADRLRAALLAEDRISFVGGARVTGVRETDRGAYTIAFDDGASQTAGPYTHVVNALWEGRLAIDMALGIAPPETWIYRHKFGNRVDTPLAPDDLASVTMVLGPFGDIVNFGANGLYLSWYPHGMVAASQDPAPPADWPDIGRPERLEVFERSLETWRRYCPKLADVAFTEQAVDPASGVIFAWGETDIDDPRSRLHARYEIGVASVGGYHSVNTGKYTMVPYLAAKTAERILGRETPGV